MKKSSQPPDPRLVPRSVMRRSQATSCARSLSLSGVGFLVVSVMTLMPANAPAAPLKPALQTPLLAPLKQPIEALLQPSIRAIRAEFSETQKLRTKIHLGQINPMLKLAPCQHIEPFLPEKKQAWGKTQIGLRCLDAQTRWQIYVPVEVKFFAQVLMTRHTITMGALIDADDVHVEPMEISHYPLAHAKQMLYHYAQINQQVPTRTLSTAQPLRSEFLRAPTIIAAGDAIRVLMRGNSFTVMSLGKALQAAEEGQTIKIKIESGRVLTGIARSNHQVDIQL